VNISVVRYPLIGLALERAPLKAYLAILAGPFFIVWRTWLALTARFGRRPVVWIRTVHGGGKGDKERGRGGERETRRAGAGVTG
jgi:hypothetical protein